MRDEASADKGRMFDLLDEPDADQDHYLRDITFRDIALATRFPRTPAELLPEIFRGTADTDPARFPLRNRFIMLAAGICDINRRLDIIHTHCNLRQRHTTLRRRHPSRTTPADSAVVSFTFAQESTPRSVAGSTVSPSRA